MPCSSRWPLLVAVASCIAAFAPGARGEGKAPSRSECVEASLAGQKLRGAGHWTAARDSFAVCGDAACPALIRNDCTKWTDELIVSVPTVILGAQDESGRDLSDVRASIDGVAVAGAAAGQAVSVDPGAHVVRYQRTDGTSVEQQFVIREGEKRRTLVLKFGSAATAAATVPAQAPPPSSETRPSAGTNTIVGASVAVAGLALIGAGVYFFTQQQSETSSVESLCAGGACRPGTPAAASVPSQVTTVNTNRALAGGTFGLGAAAIGLGAYFFFARPLGRGARSDAPLAGLQIAPTRGGAFAGYALSF